MTTPTSSAPSLREHLAARVAAILEEGQQALQAAEARAKALAEDVERLESSSLSHVLDAPAHEFRTMFEHLVSHVRGVTAPAPAPADQADDTPAAA